MQIANTEEQRWLSLKVRLIREFKTISIAADYFKCDRSAFRYMVSGRCPRLNGRVCRYFRVSSLEELIGEEVAA